MLMPEQYQCHGVTSSGKRCQRRCDNKGFCGVHPAKGGCVTKTGFAKMQGVDKSMVSKWLKDGTITETGGGFIEWGAAQQAIADARDHSRALQRQGTPHPDAMIPGELPGADDDLDGLSYDARYIRARALKQEEDHKLALLKRLEEEGRLVDADQVSLDFANIATLLRQKLRSIPDRLAHQAHACKSAAEVRRLLSKEIDIALTALADGLAQGDDDD